MIDRVLRTWNRVLAVFRRAPLDTDLDAEIASHLEAADRGQSPSGHGAGRGAPAGARPIRRRGPGNGAASRSAWLAGARRPASGPALQPPHSAPRPRVRLASSSWCWPWESARTSRSSAWSTPSCCARFLSATPNQLVWFAANGGKGGLSDQTYTVSAFEEFRRHNRSFQDVTSYQTFFNSIQYKLTGRAIPCRSSASRWPKTSFRCWASSPRWAGFLHADECRKGGRAARSLSYQFWQRQFGGDPVHRRADHHHQRRARRHHRPCYRDRRSARVLRFRLGLLSGHAGGFLCSRLHGLLAHVGEYAGGSRPSQARRFAGQAQAEADILFPELKAAHRDWFSDYKSTLSGLQDRVSGELRRSLFVLWCAVGLILLIVCINVSNLMLARAIVARQRVRHAHRARRRTRPSGPPVAHRESGALGRRRDTRPGVRLGTHLLSCAAKPDARCRCSPPSGWMAPRSPGPC